MEFRRKEEYDCTTNRSITKGLVLTSVILEVSEL